MKTVGHIILQTLFEDFQSMLIETSFFLQNASAQNQTTNLETKTSIELKYEY